MSAFFEPPPPPPEAEREYRPPPWIAPPSNMIGRLVPLELILARTDTAAVAVPGVTVFPTGIELAVAVRRRGQARSALEESPFGFHPVRRGELTDDVLRFGVQFSDGRKATSLGGMPRPHDREPSHPILLPRGGGGGGGRWDLGFWLYPLPPAGPLAFVCEWPSEGIELTRREIDAAAILEAAERAEVLWDDASAASTSAVVTQSVTAHTADE